MTWGWFMIVLTNNVLLVKIEGPVWYTIYHHRNLLWKEFLQPPLWKSTNQWEFATPMVLNHMTSWHFAHVADQLPPRSPVGCLETLRVAWPAPGRHGKLVGGITGITWYNYPSEKKCQLVGMTSPIHGKIKMFQATHQKSLVISWANGKIQDPQDPRKGGSQKSLRKGAWFGILVLGSWNPWTNKRYKKD